jgi:hypothetical protein
MKCGFGCELWCGDQDIIYPPQRREDGGLERGGGRSARMATQITGVPSFPFLSFAFLTCPMESFHAARINMMRPINKPNQSVGQPSHLGCSVVRRLKLRDVIKWDNKDRKVASLMSSSRIPVQYPMRNTIPALLTCFAFFVFSYLARTWAWVMDG